MRKGFTLIEMLLVIAILALLAAFIIPQLAPISERAKLSNSVKFFSQSFYEQQTKAQTGYHEMISPTNTAFDYHYEVYGLTLSTQRDQGARTFTAKAPTDPDNIASLTPEKTGKNILAADDAEKNIYSTIEEITIGGNKVDTLNIFFLPLSNTIVVKNNDKIFTDKIIQVTFANSRYPVMLEKLEINTGTSLLRSLPLP